MLPDSIAISIIAGLLSLLPTVVLLWIYYVRERQPTISGSSIGKFFSIGLVSVGVSVVLEKGIYSLWKFLSPDSSRMFFSDNISAGNLLSILIAAAVSFLMVALIEEGVRFILSRYMMKKNIELNQIIDGVQLGIAMGLGFAFLENTLYFLQLFKGYDFNTLVVVFFLRFLISTIGHLSFGGVMGYYLAMAEIYPTEKKSFTIKAFLIPLMMHGIFDFLLSIQLSFYTVILMIIPIMIFWNWWNDERLFEYHMLNGRRLKFPISNKKSKLSGRKFSVEVLSSMKSCPNCYVPINETQEFCTSCGVKFHRKKAPSRFPFLSFMEPGS